MTTLAIAPLPTVAGSLALWDVPRRLPAPAPAAPKMPHLARAADRLRRRALADAMWAGLFVSGLAALGGIIAGIF
jgi:hypothetical protein